MHVLILCRTGCAGRIKGRVSVLIFLEYVRLLLEEVHLTTVVRMTNDQNKDKLLAREIKKGFCLLFIPLFLVALLAVATFYYSRTSAAHQLILAGEQERIALQQKNIVANLDSVVSDLRFLASDRRLKKISGVPSERFEIFTAELTQEYLQFSTAKRMYDQIRFLDRSGKEVVRVNFNAGQPEIVARDMLQNKKGRYYFDDTLALEENEIFISPLDLNVERGQIEQPLKPMIRFGMPVLDQSGQKAGIVLLNYFGTVLLDRFHDLDRSSSGDSFLLNRSGYYLHSEDPEIEWGFMYPAQAKSSNTFSRDYPAAWTQIVLDDDGQFETGAGLFTFSTARPLSIGMKSSTGNGAIQGESYGNLNQKEYFWKLVSLVPKEVLYKENDVLKIILGAFMVGFTVLIGIGSWRISVGHVMRKQAQAKRDILLADLEETHHQLKASQSQLLQNEKMASVGQLAAGVAHEINNPLGFITGNLHSLRKYVGRLSEFISAQKGALSTAADHDAEELNALEKKLKIAYLLEDSQDLIAESLDGAERVQTIVKNLKTFSRVDQSTAQTVDLHECLESSINIIWNELKSKVEIDRDYGDIPQITCFPQQLSQVFMNLLINSSHAIVEKGQITVKTSADADYVTVEITDNGCGIAAENLKRIFEPFFTTKEVGKGTGLGLSMVFDIIKNHHGEVLATSVLGEGTTFTVKLPRQNDFLDAAET